MGEAERLKGEGEYMRNFVRWKELLGELIIDIIDIIVRKGERKSKRWEKEPDDYSRSREVTMICRAIWEQASTA